MCGIVFPFRFLRITNYSSVKWKFFPQNDYEGENFNALWVQETSTVMKWKTDVRTLFISCL